MDSTWQQQSSMRDCGSIFRTFEFSTPVPRACFPLNLLEMKLLVINVNIGMSAAQSSIARLNQQG